LSSIVAMGNADVIFRPSLLTSWVIDVEDARRYCGAWSL
jgi:hypothetical protein